MYNQEIYDKLVGVFGERRMAEVTDIIITLYNIKHNASKELSVMEEYDYERQWWMDKHIEVVKLLEQ